MVRMKYFAMVLLLAVFCGCADSFFSEAEQLQKNKPVKVAEVDGVTLWKVKDGTRGGRVWTYFTTPNGRIIEE